jgi:two-component system response regulator HydG
MRERELQRLTSQPSILLVDADDGERRQIGRELRDRGFAVTGIGVPDGLTAAFAAGDYAAALVRIGSAGEGEEAFALRALESIRNANPECQVVVLLEPNADLATCRKAVLMGASGFLEAPRGQVPSGLEERLTQAVRRYETARRESREVQDRTIFDETGFAGQSREMARVLLLARRAAAISDVPILIEGESGTGKQLLAEAIHRMDPKRHSRPFLVINCAAITGTLAESALFGHRRGAFTGATEDRAGYFRAADGGTVLLDEISELDRPLQPKLLRVLQEGKVLPVGSDREYVVDVRVIAASNRSLMVLVAEEKFRVDLYQRLNVISLTVPPLRRRADDIPLLFDYFLSKYGHYYRGTIKEVDPRVYEVLAEGLGSGNVRELENVVRQVLAFKRGGERIELSDLPESVVAKPGQEPPEHVAVEIVESVRRALRGGKATLMRLLDECERMILTEALRENAGSKSQAARRLGITRRTLYNKLRKHNLAREDS